MRSPSGKEVRKTVCQDSLFKKEFNSVFRQKPVKTVGSQYFLFRGCIIVGTFIGMSLKVQMKEWRREGRKVRRGSICRRQGGCKKDVILKFKRGMESKKEELDEVQKLQGKSHTTDFNIC